MKIELIRVFLTSGIGVTLGVNNNQQYWYDPNTTMVYCITGNVCTVKTIDSIFSVGESSVCFFKGKQETVKLDKLLEGLK